MSEHHDGSDERTPPAASDDRTGSERDVATAREMLQLSPAERRRREVSSTEVTAALREIVRYGDREQKTFSGIEFGSVHIDHETIRSESVFPVVFRDCVIEELSIVTANVDVPVEFVGCEIDAVDLTGTHFQYDVSFRDCTLGEIELEETRFQQDVDFTDAHVRGEAVFEETIFGDDASFAGAEFCGPVSMRAAEFNGTSNELGDNATFADATFRDRVDFSRASFEAASFADATFAGAVSFTDATATDELLFRGVECTGPIDFAAAAIDRMAFDEARFEGRADFSTATFTEHTSFEAVTFGDTACFDESRFRRGATFTGSEFCGDALFRGVQFEQTTRHQNRDAVFEQVQFRDGVDFRDATVASANFVDTVFDGAAVFRDVTVTVDIDLGPRSASAATYFDFTGAELKQGTITLPEGGDIWIDLTLASVGALSLRAADEATRHELLDYVRFCDTEFDGFDNHNFDFSEHTRYFKRNGWVLHRFTIPDDREYEKPTNAQNIERTYLKAKIGASNTGFVEAAAEFRLRRQRWARRTHLDVAVGSGVGLGHRLKNLSRALENLFLDVTCGYGVRLGRILLVFAVAPLLPAFLYAFGGDLFATGAGQLSQFSAVLTPAGQATLYRNLYFSYITFLTVGYGGVRPEAALSQLLAGTEVYLNIVLGGLLVYSLVKRSEL